VAFDSVTAHCNQGSKTLMQYELNKIQRTSAKSKANNRNSGEEKLFFDYFLRASRYQRDEPFTAGSADVSSAKLARWRAYQRSLLLAC